MKRIIFPLALILLSFVWSSCGTIIGGSKYYASVVVKDHPNARISYHGLQRGIGTAIFKVQRNQANKFSFTVKEEGCSEQQFDYRSRSFRGWAFVGTLVTWTGYVAGVYIPWGATIDLIDGALWKPNAAENGVIKVDHKNYSYPVNYAGCSATK